MDREASLSGGQVPIPPANGPSPDTWLHYTTLPPNGGPYIGRHSPNVPPSLAQQQSMMAASDGSVLFHPRLMGADMAPEDRGAYSEYAAGHRSTPNHVEVY